MSTCSKISFFDSPPPPPPSFLACRAVQKQAVGQTCPTRLSLPTFHGELLEVSSSQSSLSALPFPCYSQACGKSCYKLPPGFSSALGHRNMGLWVPLVRRWQEAAHYRSESQFGGSPRAQRKGLVALRSSPQEFPGIGRMRKQVKEISWVKQIGTQTVGIGTPTVVMWVSERNMNPSPGLQGLPAPPPPFSHFLPCLVPREIRGSL